MNFDLLFEQTIENALPFFEQTSSLIQSMEKRLEEKSTEWFDETKSLLEKYNPNEQSTAEGPVDWSKRTEISGYLNKKGARMWQRRFFEVKDGYLFYFSDKKKVYIVIL